jgi:hypothetical protein
MVSYITDWTSCQLMREIQLINYLMKFNKNEVLSVMKIISVDVVLWLLGFEQLDLGEKGEIDKN